MFVVFRIRKHVCQNCVLEDDGFKDTTIGDDRGVELAIECDAMAMAKVVIMVGARAVAEMKY